MGVLTTIETECRDCYKCVRGCPVKAIRVNTGHAQIWEEQCILDGHCIGICPRQAKRVRDDLPTVQALLTGEEAVAVSLAPSYVCAFDLPDPGCLVTALRKLGFKYVSETAVGADLVAVAHAAYLRERPKKEPRITSSCPTIVNLIEKH
ncbi:MAG TPA: histidine kinase, partial [Firmicutes bacterium]|nr:histidine kinase [Bacillota bacterium]